jgi:hypothetical protein
MYKGLDENYDEGLILNGFPQCSFNTDAFKNWLTQNQFSIAIGGVSSVLQFGTGNYIGGAMSALNMANEIYKHSLLPIQAKGNVGSGNLNIGLRINKFEFFYNMITDEYAKMIDNYFEKYGYKVNVMKVPETKTRPYWNYVKTKDVNLIGDIPVNDMKELKSIYDNGVTLWHGDYVGDYSLFNH